MKKPQYTPEQLKQMWAAAVASKQTDLAYEPWVAQFIISQSNKSLAVKADARKKIADHARATGKTVKDKPSEKPAKKSKAAGEPGGKKSTPAQPVGKKGKNSGKTDNPQDVHNDPVDEDESEQEGVYIPPVTMRPKRPASQEPAAVEEFEEDDAPDPAYRKSRDFAAHTRAGKERLAQEAEGKRLGLTPKQVLFCREWVLDGNGARAARAAGYSPHNAKEQASRLLTKANIQQFVAFLHAPRLEKLEITHEWLLQQYKNLAGVNLDDFFTVSDDGLMVPDMTKVDRDKLAGLAGIEIIELPPLEEDGPCPLKIKVKIDKGVQKSALDVLAKRQGFLKETEPAAPQVNLNLDSTALARRIAFILRKEAQKPKAEQPAKAE